MASSLPDYAFKYQKIWYKILIKDGRLIPICFKKDTNYKCICVDSTYGRPDPTCKLCSGTGYNNRSEIENRKWVMALSAPVDQETIEKLELGNFTKSLKMLLIGYPISPEFTKLTGIAATMRVKDADDKDLVADMGWIVQPEGQEAKISFKEKLWNGVMWEVKETEYMVLGVDSYKVSEFPVGQKVIIQKVNAIPSKKRFIPEE